MASSPLDFATRFIDGIFDTPSHIADGISEIIVSASSYSSDAAKHHYEHFSDFIEFMSSVPFNEGLSQVSYLVLRECYSRFPDETIDLLAEQLAYTGGRQAARSFLINASMTQIEKIVIDAEKKALLKKGVRSAFAIISIGDHVYRSGAAADRLKATNVHIYNILKDEGLVGGYYLIEKPAKNLIDAISHRY